jgi:hypothetical protein
LSQARNTLHTNRQNALSPVEEAEASKENSQINMRGVTLLAWIALRLAAFIAAETPDWRAIQRGRLLACADG